MGTPTLEDIRKLLREELKLFAGEVLREELAQVTSEVTGGVRRLLHSSDPSRSISISPLFSDIRDGSLAAAHFASSMESRVFAPVDSEYSRDSQLVLPMTRVSPGVREKRRRAVYVKQLRHSFSAHQPNSPLASNLPPTYTGLVASSSISSNSRHHRRSSANTPPESDEAEPPYNSKVSLHSHLVLPGSPRSEYSVPSKNDDSQPRVNSRETIREVQQVSRDSDDLGKMTTMELLAACLDSPEFEYFTCLVILVNALSIGLQADYKARHWCQDVPAAYHYTDIAFCCYFILEMCLRCWVVGCMIFFCGSGWQWNVFDVVVVTSACVDEIHQMIYGAQQSSSAVRLLRFARFLRVIRVVRFARALQFVAGLRMLIVSIGDSLQSLGWVLFVLLLQTFVFGVYLTQYVTDHKMEVGREDMKDQWELEKYYGSLDNSMLSLFEVLSDGIHWHEIMDPLTLHCTRWLVLAFVLYVAFAVVASMNVVMGVFVGSALAAAEDERKDILAQQMCQLFFDLDEDGSGEIDKEEFVRQMTSPKMQRFLKGIDLDPQDARQLFDILDMDSSGEIDATELVSGCLRLHGPAKALDLAALTHTVLQHAKRTEQMLRVVCGTLAKAQTDERARLAPGRTGTMDLPDYPVPAVERMTTSVVFKT